MRLVGATAVAVLGAAAACAGRVYAAEVSYSYGYRAQFDDNIQRVAENPKHDMVNDLLAGVTYRDRSRTLDVNLAPSVELIDYRKKTFDNEARLNLDSQVLWTVSPERLTFTAQDTARQVRINPTQPDTPANTALANLFTVGPDLYLHANPVNTLRLGSRYEDLYVSDTNLDNRRTQGYARWLYQYSPITTLSLNVETENVEFDDNINNVNFRRRDAFFRVQTRRSTESNLGIDVGRTRIALAGADKIDGSLTRLNWNTQLNSKTNFGIVAESSLADTGTDLAATAAAANTTQGTAETVSQNLVAQDVFRAKRGAIFFSRAGSLLSTNVSAVGRRLEFRIDPVNDRDEGGGDVEFAYHYSAASSFSVGYSYLRSKYKNQMLVDTDTTAAFAYQRLVTRKVTIGVQFDRDERSSTEPNREFVDHRLTFSVLYNSGTIPRRQ